MVVLPGPVIVAVPGPEIWFHRAVTTLGGSGNPSSVIEPTRLTWLPIVVVRSGPAETSGAVLGRGPPTTYSRWSSAAADGDPSYDSATRLPEPVMTIASAAAGSHCAESTACWMTTDRSGVRCAIPAAPTGAHSGGSHSTAAVVSVRLVRLCEAAVKGAAGPASALTCSVAALDDASSAWNWTHAAVISAPPGIPSPVKRSPTVWTLLPSTAISRSLESIYIQPCGNSSASSDPEATRTSIAAGGVDPSPTVTVVSSLEFSAPSSPVRRST